LHIAPVPLLKKLIFEIYTPTDLSGTEGGESSLNTPNEYEDLLRDENIPQSEKVDVNNNVIDSGQKWRY